MATPAPVSKGDIFEDCMIMEETDACYIVGRTAHERTYYDIIMLKDMIGGFKSNKKFRAQVDHIVIAHDGMPGVVVVPIVGV